MTAGAIITGLTVLSSFTAVRVYLSEQFPTALRGRGHFFGEATGRIFSGVLTPFLLEPYTGSATIFFGRSRWWWRIGACIPLLFGKETVGQLELVTETSAEAVAELYPIASRLRRAAMLIAAIRVTFPARQTGYKRTQPAGGNAMKIAKIEDLHCDAGWRTFSFLKVTTDDGLVGWSEYTEADGSRGLTGGDPRPGRAADRAQDPRPVQQIASMLWVRQVQAPGGVNSRAIAAIENALLDIKGKALGVPVYELFGGPVRKRIPVYWSHCGSYRVRNHELVGAKPLRTYDDIAALGAEVKRRGFKALKTNILPFDGEKLTNFGPGFGRTPGWPELNVDRKTLAVAYATSSRVPRRRRAGDGAASRRELPLQDRGLSAGRQGGGAVRHDLAGDRHLGPAVAGADPPRRAVPDRVAGIGMRPARVPAVLRCLCDRCGDHRRDLERLPGSRSRSPRWRRRTR